MSLTAYLDSVKARDPAARSRWEVLFYPGVIALGLHRLAHWLYGGKLYFLARMVNHFARAITQIDIHPGAKIGRNFFLDHGFSVIGETSEIGDNVTIYQCVTLGGTKPFLGETGKRHPTLGNGVVIGSGAQILGPITIGDEARVGASAVVTKDVPAGATMVGRAARAVPVEADDKHKFLPYGTPCDELGDPVLQRLCELEQEIKLLRSKVAEKDDDDARSGSVGDIRA